MGRKPVTFAIILSIAALIIGFAWKTSDPDNAAAFFLYFGGWIASLILVGYVSTPSNSVYGKISFAFVVLMVLGIAGKILHIEFSNEMIVIGLLGLVITYVIMWRRSKEVENNG